MEKFSFTNVSYPALRENIIDQRLDPEACDTIYNNMYWVFPKRREQPEIIENIKVPHWNYDVEGIRVEIVEQDKFSDVIKFIIRECLLHHVQQLLQEVETFDVELYNHFYLLLLGLLGRSESFSATDTRTKSLTAVLITTTHRTEDASLEEPFEICETALGRMMSVQGNLNEKCLRMLRLMNVESYRLVQFVMASPSVPGRSQHLALVALLKAASGWAAFRRVPCTLARIVSRELKDAFLDSDFKLVESISRLDWYEDEDQQLPYDDPFVRATLGVSYFVHFIDPLVQNDWPKYDSYYEQFHYTK